MFINIAVNIASLFFVIFSGVPQSELRGYDYEKAGEIAGKLFVNYKLVA